MKDIIVTIRDFSYLWTIKQLNNPESNEKIRYKTKFFYVVGIYYFSALGFFLYVSRKFLGFSPSAILEGSNLWLRVIVTAFIIQMPIILIGNLLLQYISPISIVKDVSQVEYKRKRNTYLLSVIVGFLTLTLAIYVTTLLGKI